MRFAISFNPSITLLLLGLVAISRADEDQQVDRYPIQATPLSGAPDVIKHMRHFMPLSMRPDERCKRIAVVLSYVNASAKKSMSDFKVADWALTKSDFIREHFSRISLEPLRELYTNAILQYRAKNQVDGGLLETIECLRSKFSRGNGNVRVFMRQPWLTKIIEQYGEISRSPASKLITSQDELSYDDQDNFKLKWSELERGVQNSIVNWMSGDELRARSLFADGDEQYETVSDAAVHQPAYNNQKQTQIPKPISQLQAKPKQSGQPTQASGSVQSKAEHGQSEKQVQRNEKAIHQQPIEPIDEDIDTSQFDYNSINWEEIYHDENLNKVLDDIRDEYLKKIDQKLGARCKAYSDVMGIETPKLVDSNAKFVPDSVARDSFLWIARHARKLFETDPDAWFDLIDCVDQWQDLDNEAKIFINHPSTADLFSQMLSNEADQDEGSNQVSSTSKAESNTITDNKQLQ